MEDDLEAIVAMPDDLEEETSASNVDVYSEEMAFGDDTLYNMDVALSFVDEDEEAIVEEVTEAVSEMSGEKSFPCAKCDKICKSKGGLTRHVRAKHLNESSTNVPSQATQTLTKEQLNLIVENIKGKITKDGYWDKEMVGHMDAVKCNELLYSKVSPLYKKFTCKMNQDKLLTDFYPLILTSCELLKCINQQLCSLIMISMPDHLVALAKKGNKEPSSGESIGGDSEQLAEHERGPLSYIAGYVLSKLKKNSRVKENDELRVLVDNMTTSGIENPYIEARSRGGLITPCNDLVLILEVVEVLFRKFVSSQSAVVKTIPCDQLCNDALGSPLLKSLWDNIIEDCRQSVTNQTAKLCLENIVKLYLKVRSFSFAKDFITKYKIEEKSRKSKSLRKELKRKRT